MKFCIRKEKRGHEASHLKPVYKRQHITTHQQSRLSVQKHWSLRACVAKRLYSYNPFHGVSLSIYVSAPWVCLHKSAAFCSGPLRSFTAFLLTQNQIIPKGTPILHPGHNFGCKTSNTTQRNMYGKFEMRKKVTDCFIGSQFDLRFSDETLVW